MDRIENRQNREIVLAAVQQDGYALGVVSEKFKMIKK
jgi:hypothetical protein